MCLTNKYKVVYVYVNKKIKKKKKNVIEFMNGSRFVDKNVNVMYLLLYEN